MQPSPAGRGAASLLAPSGCSDERRAIRPAGQGRISGRRAGPIAALVTLQALSNIWCGCGWRRSLLRLLPSLLLLLLRALLPRRLLPLMQRRQCGRYWKRGGVSLGCKFAQQIPAGSILVLII